MLILRTEVDKKVNDLLMREVKMLDWESVPKEEFESIEDKRLKLCPTDILTKCPSHYFSTEIKIDILTRIARSINVRQYHIVYKNAEKLRSLLNDWVGYIFLKDNLQYILNIIDTYSKKPVLSTLHLVLVSKGLIKFTDVNIELAHIYQDYSLVVPEVKQETWLDLCKNTNYIHGMQTYEGCMSYSQVLPLYNEQLKSINLFEIENHKVEQFKNYSEGSGYYSELLEKYAENGVFVWDKLVDILFDNKIDYSVLDEYWKFALETQNVDKEMRNYKNESFPKEWTRLDL